MDNSVVIKGNKNGIAVKMDASVSFDELKAMIRDKFTASAKFFNNAALALSLEGRELSDTQEKEIMDIISEVTDINIVCLIDHDEERDLIYQRAVADAMNNKNKLPRTITFPHATTFPPGFTSPRITTLLSVSNTCPDLKVPL